jgi:hypothetical protein
MIIVHALKEEGIEKIYVTMVIHAIVMDKVYSKNHLYTDIFNNWFKTNSFLSDETISRNSEKYNIRTNTSNIEIIRNVKCN